MWVLQFNKLIVTMTAWFPGLQSIIGVCYYELYIKMCYDFNVVQFTLLLEVNCKNYFQYNVSQIKSLL